MTPAWKPLLRALSDPAAMAGFDVPIWDLVLRQASAAGVLGRLGALARREHIASALPETVQHHMQAALTIAEQQQRAVRWELVQLARTFSDIEGPVVLLKGAAYAASDQPPAPGRLFGDIDLLVPKPQIDAAESALMLDGWISATQSAYDQRYYRQWMHELPPMTHIERRTVLDLHHAILPATARIQTPSAPLISAARPLAEHPRFSIPAPADLVLHSATHLFHEGEWQHGLRDLADFDAMLRAWGNGGAFWDELLARADTLNLGRPLFYGLRYSQRLLSTPMPANVVDRCPGRPSGWGAALMDRCFVPAFSTAHQSCRLPGAGVAASALYVRSHWLRMKPHLLLPHLARKAWQSNVAERFAAKEPTAEQPAP